MEDFVILVDESDQEIGQMEKFAAHFEGQLHRAFSVFIFNGDGEILMQKRNINKYHSGGLWSNTCCSHPRPGEKTELAASRRLYEEMGMKCILFKAFSFIYKSELDNNLTEHELDHVYFGYSNNPPSLNLEEAEDFEYVKPEVLQGNIKKNPELYTSWLKICLDNLINHISEKN